MGIFYSKRSRELSELQKQTLFDRREFRQWYKNFKVESPDGRLNRRHFSTLYTQIFPDGDPRDWANYVFDVFDEDKNGYIDFREFICSLSVLTRGSLEEKLTWMFQLYDVNKDGVISYQEMLAIFRASYKMNHNKSDPLRNEAALVERVDMVFWSMNKDRNSTINFNEFLHCSKQDAAVMSALLLSDSLP